MMHRILQRSWLLFSLFWLLLFVLYLPAARAGFVADFTGWLESLRYHSLPEYLNRSHFVVKSLYQLTQLTTLLLYKILGSSHWGWHLLHISLQALNASLLCRLFWQLQTDAGLRHAAPVSLAAALLFCLSPGLSEVVVWEPSFHYLQAFLFILLLLGIGRRFLLRPSARLAWLSALLYTLSSFALELFYLTPWLILAMGLYYRYGLQRPKAGFQALLRRIILPQWLIFCAHLLLYKLVYGSWVSHIGTGSLLQQWAVYLAKPPKYLFHILLMGRFWPAPARQAIYDFCSSGAGLLVFYLLIMAAACIWFVRRRQTGPRGRLALLLLGWAVLSMGLLLPLWFGDLLLLIYDRYMYMLLAWLLMLLCLLAGGLRKKWLAAGLLGIYALAATGCSLWLNRLWQQCARITDALMQGIRNPGRKTVLLLNVPENMQGLPMIGSLPQSEFKLMHNLLYADTIRFPVYDVYSYNMQSPQDGAHVQVLNDSTLRVTLNQWGSWWWYAGHGAGSYETPAYRAEMKDVGHMYELILKGDPAQYLILYQAGWGWKEVDMKLQEKEQF